LWNLPRVRNHNLVLTYLRTPRTTPQGATFELLESGCLTPILLDGEEEEEGEEGEEETKNEGGGRGRPPGRLVGRGCPHCAHKLHVKFVDMLTYPRPVRKFEVRHQHRTMRRHCVIGEEEG
jgi:hypothetical protein